MTQEEIQQAVNDAACQMCAQLSPQVLGYLQLQQLSTISEAAEAGGETAPDRYPTLGVQNALTNAVIVRTGPGRLLTGLVQHNQGGDLFLQMFDASSIPADGAVPLLGMRVGDRILSGFDYGTSGLPVQLGIVLALSSTFAVKTTGGLGNVGLFTATYR